MTHKIPILFGQTRKKLTTIYLRRPPPIGTFMNSRFGKTFFSSALRNCLLSSSKISAKQLH